MSGVATPADGVTVSTEPTAPGEIEVTEQPDVTVDVVVAALAPDPADDDPGDDDDPDAPGWTVKDPVFWETVQAIGEPKLRHPIDMVLHRGPHTRTITVFDAVIDDGRGRHR